MSDNDYIHAQIHLNEKTVIRHYFIGGIIYQFIRAKRYGGDNQ